jgi:hypothetical protein
VIEAEALLRHITPSLLRPLLRDRRPGLRTWRCCARIVIEWFTPRAHGSPWMICTGFSGGKSITAVISAVGSLSGSVPSFGV